MNAEEDAVLEAFDALDDALARRDLDAIVTCFVPDDDLTFWGSAGPERAVGRAQLAELMAWVTGAPGSFSVTYAERRAHVEHDVAWVNAIGTAVWERGPGDVLRLPYRLTGILVRRDARWRWHTYHASEPAELER